MLQVPMTLPQASHRACFLSMPPWHQSTPPEHIFSHPSAAALRQRPYALLTRLQASSAAASAGSLSGWMAEAVGKLSLTASAKYCVYSEVSCSSAPVITTLKACPFLASCSLSTTALMDLRGLGLGLGAVGLWGCGAVGLWGCGAVGLWGAHVECRWGLGGEQRREVACGGACAASVGYMFILPQRAQVRSVKGDGGSQPATRVMCSARLQADQQLLQLPT
jgi:hypothetical protein